MTNPADHRAESADATHNTCPWCSSYLTKVIISRNVWPLRMCSNADCDYEESRANQPDAAPGPYTDYSDYTQCQEYGHQYYDSETRPGMRVCSDCHDEYFDEDRQIAKEAGCLIWNGEPLYGQTLIKRIAAQIAHNNEVLADGTN